MTNVDRLIYEVKALEAKTREYTRVCLVWPQESSKWAVSDTGHEFDTED